MEFALKTTERLAITGVSHVEFHVSDLDASVAWYGAVVDLERVKDGPGNRAQLGPKSGAFRLVLTETDPTEVRGDVGHVAIALESIDVLHAWGEHLVDIGAPHTPVRESTVSPGVFAIDVFDPDGHHIELIVEP